MAWDTITPYNRGFREFSAAFEAFSFSEIHAGALPFLPKRPGLALDVGAGSGRDADWFAQHEWEIVAVEPADAMRAEAMVHFCNNLMTSSRLSVTRSKAAK